MSVILLLRSNITKTSFSVHSLVFLMFQSILFATHLRLDPLLATRHVYVRAKEINAIYEIRYPPDSRDFSQHSAKKKGKKSQTSEELIQIIICYLTETEQRPTPLANHIH